MSTKENKYRCPHCGKVEIRECSKAWVKSYCDKTGKTVHMQKIKTDEQNDKSQNFGS